MRVPDTNEKASQARENAEKTGRVSIQKLLTQERETRQLFGNKVSIDVTQYNRKQDSK